MLGVFLLKSIHSLNACSSAAQFKEDVFPADAAEAVEAQQVSIADIGPMHGEVSVVLGRFILSLLTDCRRMGEVAVESGVRGGIVG